jgi:N-carbamoyl-L-amino-acid hydrolase
MTPTIKTKHPIVDKLDQRRQHGTPQRCRIGVFAGLQCRIGPTHVDADGKTFGNELKRIGWQGDEAVGARNVL